MAIRRRLLAVVGIVVGIVTLRAFRQRRAKKADAESETTAEEPEPETASEHAAAAAEHARLAAKKAAGTDEEH